MDDQKRKLKIIEEFLSGKFSKEGEELFNQWFDSEDKENVLDGNSEKEDLIRKEVFTKIKAEVDYHENEAQKKNLTVNHIWRWAAVFAGLLIFAGLVYAFLWQDQNVKVMTAFGERKTIILPDHSRVTLNGNSSLIYNNGWKGDSERLVRVKGEAFFDVVHTYNHKKFTVKLENHLEVEVLGTTFNVNSRPANTRVVLSRGKVKVKVKNTKEAEDVLMKPGELVLYDNQKLIKEKVNVKMYTSWVNNELIFEKTSLSDIAQILRNTYGIEVIFKDPALKVRKFTGSAQADDLRGFIKKIEFSFGARITKNNNQLIIEKK